MILPEEKREVGVRLKLQLAPERRVTVEPDGREACVQQLVLIDAGDLRIRDVDLADEVPDPQPIRAREDGLERETGSGEEQGTEDRRHPERDGQPALVGAREQ